MDLYLDQTVTFEKIAAEVDLPEDAAKWPQEIMQELYKQVPYVADFHPDVNMETVNAEQGYGFGHFEVQNKTESPTGTTPEQEQQVGIRHVRIPVIVKDFKLQPFDILITEDSKMLPLTESRLRQAIFRPQAFDVTSRTPGDQSMIGQLYPPYRQNSGMGGGGTTMSADMGKTSAASDLEEYLKEAEESDLTKRIAAVLDKKKETQVIKSASLGIMADDPEEHKWQNRMGRAGALLGGAGLGATGFASSAGQHPAVRAAATLGGIGVGGLVGYAAGNGSGASADIAIAKKAREAAAAEEATKNASTSYPVSDAGLKQSIKDIVPKVKVAEPTHDQIMEKFKQTLYGPSGQAGGYRPISQEIIDKAQGVHLPPGTPYDSPEVEKALGLNLKTPGMPVNRSFGPSLMGGAFGYAGSKDGDGLGGALAGSVTGGVGSVLAREASHHLGLGGGAAGALGVVASAPAGYLGGMGYSALKDRMVDRTKTSSILEAIKGTVYEGDYNKVANSIAALAPSYLANRVFTQSALNKLAHMDPQSNSLEKRAARYESAVRPDVLQLSRVQDGYRVKMACSYAWQPEVKHLDRWEAVRAFGEKVVLAADATGAVTMDTGPAVSEEGMSPGESKPDVVASFGLYKVQSEDGRDLVGFVIPNLVDVDGSALPLALFTNGSEAALQGEIVGELAGAGTNLPQGEPRDHGTFYRVLPSGGVEATVPLTIQGGVGDKSWVAQTFDGQTVTVAIQPNVKRPVSMDGTLILPEGYMWCPMGEAKEVKLVEDPQGFNKQSAVDRKLASVVVRAGSESSFSFDGIPLNKLARDEHSFLTYDDSVFLLAGLGVDAKYGSTKLAESLAFGLPVEIRVGRYIDSMENSQAESLKTAQAVVGRIPTLKVDLTKEAAFLPDPTAVDTVLSLGFINPENIHTFVSYLPKLEDVESKICELLIASRLGAKDLPIGALEKTVRTMESVIEGLKILAFTGKS